MNFLEDLIYLILYLILRSDILDSFLSETDFISDLKLCLKEPKLIPS